MSTITWLGGKSGFWSAAARWSGGHVPQAGDDVVIGAGDDIVVTAAAAAAAISLGAGAKLQVEATLDVSGTLDGGTVQVSGGTVDLANDATLDGVTWIGALTVLNEALDITGGLNLLGPGGTAGTLDLRTQGVDAQLTVLDTETWNNSTITGTGFINEDGPSSANVLTLGPRETVLSAADGGFIDFSGYNPATNAHTTIDNKGLIIDDNSVGFAFATFDNAGTILIGAGATADAFEEIFRSTGLIEATAGTGTFSTYYNNLPDGGAVTNYAAATGKLTGGTWEAASGATLDLLFNGTTQTADAPILVDAATLVLNGPAAAIQTWDIATGAWQSVATTVAGISGTLDLLGGADWAGGGALTVGGTVMLDGGTLTAPGGLHIDGAQALVAGSGTIATGAHAVALDGGTILAQGGLLDVANSIGGTGGLAIAAGATLELGGAAGDTVTFLGLGSLLLAKPSLFTGTLAGVSAGDTLVLTGVTALSAMLSAGTLDIGLAHGHSEMIAVAHDLVTVGVSYEVAGGSTTLVFTAATPQDTLASIHAR